MANEIYGVIVNGEIVQWTMKPQTDGSFVVCDVNDLPDKKFVNGELKNLTAAEKRSRDAALWQEKRIAEYGQINDQLDEIYHDFDSWKDRISAIKAKYPKP